MPKYAITISWDEKDQIFVATAPELPGCIAHGATQELALANVLDAVEFWLETARELGREVPLPAHYPMAVGQ